MNPHNDPPMIADMNPAGVQSVDASSPLPSNDIRRATLRARWQGGTRWLLGVRWWHWLVSCLLVGIVAAAIYQGLRLREATWNYSQGIHFRGDIGNGWRWGDVANKYGLFDLYDILDNEGIPERRDKIDYTPLRLTVMTRWVAWTKVNYPFARQWMDEYNFTRPLLDFNTATELASSVLVFLIIWLWRVRMNNAGRPPGTVRPAFCGVVAGLFGALLFWFNPSVVWNSHAWPQWDVWLIPFFLAALLAASLDCWFVAGSCIVIGAFLKGQILLGAPILILWPLFSGRFMAVAHFVCGFVFMAALLALPWMHIDKPAYTWLGLLAAALAVQIPIVMKARLQSYWIAAIVLTSILLAWPWRSVVPEKETGLLGPWIVVSMLLVRFARRWDRPQFYGLAIGLAVLLTMLFHGSSTAWYTIGFEFGAEKFDGMMTGSGSWNIAAMLVRYFRFDRDPMEMVSSPWPIGAVTVPEQTIHRCMYLVALLLAMGVYVFQVRRSFKKRFWPALLVISIPYSYLVLECIKSILSSTTGPSVTYSFPFFTDPVPIRKVLSATYLVLMLVCGVAAAVQARRRDTRFLAAVVSPWLIFFLVLVQMHGRYSLWAAGISALMAGVSTGLALLGVVISIVSWLGILEGQLGVGRVGDPGTLQTLRNLDPHMGLLYVVIALVYLYVAIMPRRNPAAGRLPVQP